MAERENFVYLEIAETIRRLILSGEFAPGDRLSPVREMARALELHAQHSEPCLLPARARRLGDRP